MQRKYAVLLLLVLFSSCRLNRNLVLFDNLRHNEVHQLPVAPDLEPRIQTNDLLRIWVSSMEPESNLLFNSGILLPAGGQGSAVADSKFNDGYLVDAQGNIHFPVVGEIHLLGLTKRQATEKLAQILRKFVKDPVVTIRFLNFQVTVLGEVTSPNTFTIPTERVNVLEALGMAGGMTAFGRRENVLIIREENGVRTSIRLNLNGKDVLSSPYYHLRKNDIVYVEPHNQALAAQTSPFNRFIPIIISAMSALTIYIATVSR